jgi:serine/threonine protein kinase
MKNTEADKVITMPMGFGKSIQLVVAEEVFPWYREKTKQLLSGTAGSAAKSSQFSTVLRFKSPGTAKILYFKEFHRRGFKDLLKNLIGYTRAEKDFKGSMRLLRKGFYTSVPLFYGVVKRFGIIQRNFLVTKEVPGKQSYQYLGEHFSDPRSGSLISEKREFLQAAGLEIGRLHSRGIFHGDLRVGNILIDGTGSSARFSFIDNERTVHYPQLPYAKRLKNLVQLNMIRRKELTRTDRLRFFNAYISCNKALLPQRKEIIRQIQERTENRRGKKNL